MNKMKSLLLGTAAGLLAVTGAQAADLPAAEPVEYVKVCDTYGVGYWFIPGTDTCIKIGGYVRVEISAHESNVAQDRWPANPFVVRDDDAAINVQNDTLAWRTRGLLNFDARSETEYGTLRSFIQFRGTGDDNDNPTMDMDLAFIQFAGFTAGIAPSILDFSTVGHFSDHVGDWNHEQLLISYTAQIGGGFSFTFGAQSNEREDTSVIDAGPGTIAYSQQRGAATTFANLGDTRTELPMGAAAFRVTQGWGEAMLGGSVREVKIRDSIGFPDETQDDLGFTVNGGLKVNLPMLAKGDTFIVRAAYGEGTTDSVIQEYSLSGGNRVGQGGIPDGIYNAAGDFVLAEAFSVYGGLTHYWRPNLRSNFVGSYGTLDYDGSEVEAISATANLIYTPVKNLDIGIEGIYANFQGDDLASELGFGFSAIDEKDNDAFGALLRIQRNFGS